MRKISFNRIIAPIASLAMIICCGAETLWRPGPKDAEAYHARVRAIVGSMPYEIGDWCGSDVAVPQAAKTLLRPNKLLNRSYLNTSTNEKVGLLLVQCGDARDMVGHYPPVCYVAQGMTQTSAEPKQWVVGDKIIRGKAYTFERSTFGAPSQRRVVYNFMILPDGKLVPDILDVQEAAADYTQRFYGAAQIQLVFDAMSTEQRRDQVFNAFIAANMPVIETIRKGAAQ